MWEGMVGLTTFGDMGLCRWGPQLVLEARYGQCWMVHRYTQLVSKTSELYLGGWERVDHIPGCSLPDRAGACTRGSLKQRP